MVRAVLTGSSVGLGFDFAWVSSLSSERFCIVIFHTSLACVHNLQYRSVHLYSTLSQKNRQEDRQYNKNIEIKTLR